MYVNIFLMIGGGGRVRFFNNLEIKDRTGVGVDPGPIALEFGSYDQDPARSKQLRRKHNIHKFYLNGNCISSLLCELHFLCNL